VFVERVLELGQSRNQRFGDEASAELTKVTRGLHWGEGA
jgi:hypothetical protein